MRKLLDAVGPVPRVIVAILGVLVAGLIALGLLFLVAGESSAFLGALALAVIVATPMTIVYVVARILHKAPSAATSATQPHPGDGFQSYPVAGQRLHNPDELR